MSQLKIKDGNSWINIPAGGIGVPSGGTAGQVLTKSSATDYATEWALPLSMKLLWTNPSPTASFDTQTITLNLSEYDFVGIVVRFGPNSNSEHEARSITFMGVGWPASKMQCIPNVASLANIAHRRAKVLTTGVDFGNGYDNATLSQTRAIPIQIYGIKGIT